MMQVRPNLDYEGPKSHQHHRAFVFGFEYGFLKEKLDQKEAAKRANEQLGFVFDIGPNPWSKPATSSFGCKPSLVKMEYVSPEGLRLDGRRPMEMRQIRAEIGTVARADGSAVFEMGNTKVIAAVYGPREVQNRSQQISDQALVRCEYSMANFSTGDRMRKPKGDRRSTEISLVIRQTMEACILTHLMPRSQIDIFVQVLQADGGTRSACINAATLALADAGIPMRDIVTSCSAGYLNSTPLLDLNYIEDSAGGPDVTVGILPKLDKVTLLQMDAKLPLDIFENVMGLATEGCKAVANYIREVLLENTKQLEYRRGL
ncbi:3'-5'-exoribonuclease family protein isoform 1 [Theobroma cacao]|uniref:3'-5'-exoribonuclease family protein isoform 1 n=3 Tax=Theobroma cacao TaxID=3641 RepID=A0A061E0L1_THECC|nr:3'-5'-exoribonuclease family protein isoform 1 [Theobroma cacao]